MVKMQDSCRRAVQRVGCEEESKPLVIVAEMGVHLVIVRLVQTDPFGEVNWICTMRSSADRLGSLFTPLSTYTMPLVQLCLYFRLTNRP